MDLLSLIISFLVPAGASVIIDLVQKLLKKKDKVTVKIDDKVLDGYDAKAIAEILKKVQDSKHDGLPPTEPSDEEQPQEDKPDDSKESNILLRAIRVIVKEELIDFEQRNEQKSRSSNTKAFIAGAAASFVISLLFFILGLL